MGRKDTISMLLFRCGPPPPTKEGRERASLWGLACCGLRGPEVTVENKAKLGLCSLLLTLFPPVGQSLFSMGSWGLPGAAHRWPRRKSLRRRAPQLHKAGVAQGSCDRAGYWSNVLKPFIQQHPSCEGKWEDTTQTLFKHLPLQIQWLLPNILSLSGKIFKFRWIQTRWVHIGHVLYLYFFFQAMFFKTWMAGWEFDCRAEQVIDDVTNSSRRTTAMSSEELL